VPRLLALVRRKAAWQVVRVGPVPVVSPDGPRRPRPLAIRLPEALGRLCILTFRLDFPIRLPLFEDTLQVPEELRQLLSAVSHVDSLHVDPKLAPVGVGLRQYPPVPIMNCGRAHRRHSNGYA
jgi:hypothetical protein